VASFDIGSIRKIDLKSSDINDLMLHAQVQLNQWGSGGRAEST
jgi:hypothetical protein